MTTGRAQLRQPFLFVGNHPCLDFINTQMIVRGNPTDLLGGCEDLVAWLVQAHMVDKVQAAVVMTQWGHEDQEQLFEQGITFRRTLRDMAARIVARKSIPDSAIVSINKILSRWLYSVLGARDGNQQLGWGNGRILFVSETRQIADGVESLG